jgi:putative ABC transport system permease protein
MQMNDAFKTAKRSLAQGKMRSLLTMLGIVIGIASVIVLMSIGQSAQALIVNQVQSVGSNLVFVIPGGSPNNRFSSPAASQGIVITSLRQRDVDALERELSITNVVADVRGQAQVVYGDNDVTTTFNGTTANHFAVLNMMPERGLPFTKSDVDSLNRVAVIGKELANTLFGPNSDPINKKIRVKDLTFRVVGVLPPKGTGTFGIDQDNLVLVPISVAQSEMLGINHFNDLIVEGNAAYEQSFIKSRITFILRQNHSISDPAKDDFTIRTQEDLLSLLGNITSILTIFLAAIASISLIVGGIGIMNIMLVSVSERTREIGLRKAVGATDRDILQQFLIEAVLLTFLGGLAGLLFGTLVVGLIYVAAVKFSTVGWVFVLPMSAVVLALVVSTLSGLAFGIYPARQAAKKNPIDALRYE